MKAVGKLVSKQMDKVRRAVTRHGLHAALFTAALKAINSVVVLRILRGVYVEDPAPSFLKGGEGFAAGFLSPDKLRDFARDPATQISHAFLDKALGRGDECYAFRDGETLAAYGWYAFGRTPVGIGPLELRFDPSYVYMYKGFTDERYRGHRLHAVGMTRALQHYRRRGYAGLVSYVEAQNFDSLKSCFRMGYRVFGSIYVLRLFGRYFALSSPGCARFDFRLVQSGSTVGDLGFGK